MELGNKKNKDKDPSRKTVKAKTHDQGAREVY